MIENMYAPMSIDRLMKLTKYHTLHNWKDVSDSDTNAMLFYIDNYVFKVQEDPEDGWRSCCREVEEVHSSLPLLFRENGTLRKENEIYQFLNLSNEVVAEFGTNRDDSWYPCYVCNIYPEKLLCNQNGEGKANG